MPPPRTVSAPESALIEPIPEEPAAFLEEVPLELPVRITPAVERAVPSRALARGGAPDLLGPPSMAPLDPFPPVP